MYIMPPKRISKAQAEIMRNKQIVDNIREMAGLERGQRADPLRGTPAGDAKEEEQMDTISGFKMDKDNLNYNLIQDLVGDVLSAEILNRIPRLSNPELANPILDKLRVMLQSRNTPTPKMARDMEVAIRDFFDETVSKRDLKFFNKLNEIDFGSIVAQKVNNQRDRMRQVYLDRHQEANPEIYINDLEDVMPRSMIDKYGEEGARDLIKKVSSQSFFGGEAGAAGNPNTGFKKMKGKSFLKSDDPLAAKALREITEAFQKKGSKLSREEKNAILDPYLSGEVGQAPAKPTMSRPRKPKQAQVVRPMTTTGSLYERVKELQKTQKLRANQAASAVASRVAEAAGRAGVKAEAAEKQATKTAANRGASAIASQVAEAAGRAAVAAETAEMLVALQKARALDLDAIFTSDDEDDED